MLHLVTSSAFLHLGFIFVGDALVFFVVVACHCVVVVVVVVAAADVPIDCGYVSSVVWYGSVVVCWFVSLSWPQTRRVI